MGASLAARIAAVLGSLPGVAATAAERAEWFDRKAEVWEDIAAAYGDEEAAGFAATARAEAARARGGEVDYTRLMRAVIAACAATASGEHRLDWARADTAELVSYGSPDTTPDLAVSVWLTVCRACRAAILGVAPAGADTPTCLITLTSGAATSGGAR